MIHVKNRWVVPTPQYGIKLDFDRWPESILYHFASLMEVTESANGFIDFNNFSY